MCVASAHAILLLEQYALVTSQRLLRVIIHAKGAEFSTMGTLRRTRVLDVCDRYMLVTWVILAFASISEQKRFRNILMRAITM